MVRKQNKGSVKAKEITPQLVVPHKLSPLKRNEVNQLVEKILKGILHFIYSIYFLIHTSCLKMYTVLHFIITFYNLNLWKTKYVGPIILC
jgi:hypothetical protein